MNAVLLNADVLKGLQWHNMYAAGVVIDYDVYSPLESNPLSKLVVCLDSQRVDYRTGATEQHLLPKVGKHKNIHLQPTVS
jgi:hypothetical protein